MIRAGDGGEGRSGTSVSVVTCSTGSDSGVVQSGALRDEPGLASPPAGVDADENPYNFSIQGAGTTAAVPETEMQAPLLVANGRAVLRWASVSSAVG